ncbi:hypothetical protein ACIBVL_26090 [Streptomyces sp. NPDC049687]|uniref:hypothetical protein n=1 Tax=Streptomyces sp. NPDC049687 TaxID=3365596 RepID=UPI0037889318
MLVSSPIFTVPPEPVCWGASLDLPLSVAQAESASAAADVTAAAILSRWTGLIEGTISSNMSSRERTMTCAAGAVNPRRTRFRTR